MSNKLTLATTKIGDLLIKNRITNTGKGVLPDVKLHIPEYQRPYKWTAKNANQLLDDITEACDSNKEVYRVGTLILHQDEEEKYNVVDGQQRVITFSLLLSAFNDVMSAEGNVPADDIGFLDEEVSLSEYNYENIVNNYNSLKRRIKYIADKNYLKALRDYIKQNCELIVVITDDISEAFQFFDSQNARGRRLYPHDLLKAYHLREMRDMDDTSTEKIVKIWEDSDQKKLSSLFSDYLYRIKSWIKDDRPDELNEHNIDMFKGITAIDKYPYATFYKGAYSYADDLNHSSVPYVTGDRVIRPFQISAPVVAGKAFFDYAKHYFEILTDIQDNSKYEGYYINDNAIVKTLDLSYGRGKGNRITRLMFDTAILLYVDRFCPDKPEKSDTELLDQFVLYALIWAYSMRAQYYNVGWLVAQNYIMGKGIDKSIVNSFNIYKVISDAMSPRELISRMSDRLTIIENDKVVPRYREKVDGTNDDGVYMNFMHFFKDNGFWRE